MNTSITRVLGTGAEHRESLGIALAMAVVTAAYSALSYMLVDGYQLNVYELVGTWTGLVTVWLSRTRNILCWPWGLVSALALGAFFAQIGLPGQQWLNWGYFFVIQWWAWWHWAYGGTSQDSLPVTALSTTQRVAVVGAVIIGTLVAITAINVLAPASNYPWLDALVVAASVVAQYLLGRKNIESWLLWLGPVNAVSIALFALSGAYIVMALYIAFFIHALAALRAWRAVQQ